MNEHVKRFLKREMYFRDDDIFASKSIKYFYIEHSFTVNLPDKIKTKQERKLENKRKKNLKKIKNFQQQEMEELTQKYISRLKKYIISKNSTVNMNKLLPQREVEIYKYNIKKKPCKLN